MRSMKPNISALKREKMNRDIYELEKHINGLRADFLGKRAMALASSYNSRVVKFMQSIAHKKGTKEYNMVMDLFCNLSNETSNSHYVTQSIDEVNIIVNALKAIEPNVDYDVDVYDSSYDLDEHEMVDYYNIKYNIKLYSDEVDEAVFNSYLFPGNDEKWFDKYNANF